MKGKKLTKNKRFSLTCCKTVLKGALWGPRCGQQVGREQFCDQQVCGMLQSRFWSLDTEGHTVKALRGPTIKPVGMRAVPELTRTGNPLQPTMHMLEPQPGAQGGQYDGRGWSCCDRTAAGTREAAWPCHFLDGRPRVGLPSVGLSFLFCARRG